MDEADGREAATLGSRIRGRALELFIARGVDATPLREIAVGLDVTKAALYYHFPSKDELLHSLVMPYFDDLGAVLLEREDLPTGEAGGLVAMMEALATIRTRHADVVTLLADPAVRRMVRLAIRLEELHERSISCLSRSTGPTGEERVRAVAALAVLDRLACLPPSTRPSPEQAALIAVDVVDPARPDVHA